MNNRMENDLPENNNEKQAVFKVTIDGVVTYVPASLIELYDVVMKADPDAEVLIEGKSSTDSSEAYQKLVEGPKDMVIKEIKSKMLTVEDYAIEMTRFINTFVNNSECVIINFSAYFRDHGLVGATVISNKLKPELSEVKQYYQGLSNQVEMFKTNIEKLGYKVDDNLIIPFKRMP